MIDKQLEALLDHARAAGLPDTLMQLAALDPLRGEGLALAERLSAEGTAGIFSAMRSAPVRR